MRRAFAYVRRSREDQGDPRWSIPTQIERIKEAVARRDDCEFAGVFEDRNISGAKPFNTRPGWSELEFILQEGDIVLVNDLSRFARDTEIAKSKFRELRSRGIEMVALGIEGIDHNSADGQMLLGIFLEFVEWQRKKIIENLKQVHRKIHQDGKALGTSSRLGYDYINQEWKINEGEAELVRRIFALEIAGYHYQAIADKLEAEGVKTKRGGQWRACTINRILHNHTYIGEREYLGEVRPVDIPAIIDRETWELAHASMQSKSRAPRLTRV